MYIVWAILIVIVGVLLVLTVLVQNSKGGGLAANFASGNQTFGVRQTADFLEKLTWYLVIAIFVFCFAATASIPQSKVDANRKSAVQQQREGSMPFMQQDFPVTGGATDSQPDSAQ
jgi:preprotein translocase subunit SecG